MGFQTAHIIYYIIILSLIKLRMSHQLFLFLITAIILKTSQFISFRLCVKRKTAHHNFIIIYNMTPYFE